MKTGWAAFLGAGAVVVALAWPAGAGRVALALVSVVAGAVVVPTVTAARRRFAVVDEAVPFRATVAQRIPPGKPNQLLVLERSIASSAAPGDTVTFAVRDQLRANARRRLVDHHRVDPDDPADHAAVHRLVSPELWKVVGPLPRDHAGRTGKAPPIRRADLAGLVAEIERL